MIKHVSFDLWYTIIKSNPRFGAKRDFGFFQILKSISNDVSLEHIQKGYKKIKKMADPLGESTGVGLTKKQLYFLFLEQLFGEKTHLILRDNTDLIDRLDGEYEKLFMKYPPLLIDKNALSNVLTILKSKNITTNILSNTTFANGNLLFKVLQHYKLSTYFDSFIFSDEVGYFKPNPNIFLSAYYNELFYLNVSNKNEVLHVGDNSYADYKGASDFGFTPFLFSPSTPNYQEILTHIK